MSDAALKEMWLKYRGWAARANEVKGGLDRWRWWVLVLTVSAAVLATLAAQIKPFYDDANVLPQVISGASAVIMTLVAFIARSMLDPGIEQRWIRARALAESAKAESYRYAARIPPYDGTDSGVQMIEKVESLLTAGADIPVKDEPAEKALESLPNYPLQIEDYIRLRIDDQVDGFYRPKAAQNERNANLCAYATQILSAFAAVLGALGTFYPKSGVEIWVATIGTVTGAISAFALGRRYQQLAATYRVTADRLALRLARWRIQTQQAKSVAADVALVTDIEGLISAENQAWMAEFQSARTSAPQPPPQQQRPPPRT
jgi:hypothetical protein